MPLTAGPSESRSMVVDWLNAGWIRGVTFLLSSIIFHIVPTALEISMVCGILVSRIGHDDM